MLHYYIDQYAIFAVLFFVLFLNLKILVAFNYLC